MPLFTEFGVNNTASLNNAIAAINAASSGSTVEIDLLNDITLNAQLAPIVSAPGVTVTINGGGHTLSGNDAFRGLFVYSGTVTVENLEISHAVARGGDGTNGGGGGAGFGGGLFVADDVADGAASPGNVTLVNVGFDNDKAVGGNGGNVNVNNVVNLGGHLFVLATGGGGGMGGSATPGSFVGFFGNEPGLGGPGIGPNGFGVGGTPGGTVAGFGGGGYGGGLVAGEDGGYGGGGGGGGNTVDPVTAVLNAHGGFGAGDGFLDGGGGLGAGGDVFVQQGAGLTIVGGTMQEGSAVGGSGGNFGNGFGDDIFMQGNAAIHLGTGSVAGQVTTINGMISDETGSPGEKPAGQGTVVIEGAGTVVLSGGFNPIFGTYAGAAVLNNQATSGTLDATASSAAGGGVLFEGPATLRLENEVFQAQDHGNPGHFDTVIIGFGYADVIDLPGLAFAAGAQAQYNTSTHALVVTSGGVSDTLSDVFAPVLPSFSAISDGTGGTEVVEARNAGAPSGTSAALVMRSASTGQFAIFDFGHNAVLGAAILGYVELRSTQSQWQLAGLGAFSGTDTADMMLRNSTTGALELYDVSNNNFTAGFAVGQVGLEWQVSGFGNFSSRGETDMLMRNGAGQFEIYDISNNAITSAASMGQVGNEWQIAGFGDFSTRAGETDMLMRNVNTGQFEIYDIGNNQLTSAASMGQVGLEWSVAGFGDFSGNANETDMLMRNSNTGAFEIFGISHNQLTSATAMGQVGLEWSVLGFGSIDGAGESDLLMRNRNTGALEVYDITNNQITGAAATGQIGLEWQVGGLAADPPGGSAIAGAQLAQAMASYASPAGAIDASAPFADAAAQAAATPLAASNGQNHV